MDDQPRLSLYDSDFFEWTQHQAELLRGDDLSEIDAANLAEEIEDLGRELIAKIRSHLKQIFIHLIKMETSSDARLIAGWEAEVMNHVDLVQDTYSPSMRSKIDVDKVWRRACREVPHILESYGETLSIQLADECPFTLDEFLDEARTIDSLRGRCRKA